MYDLRNVSITNYSEETEEDARSDLFQVQTALWWSVLTSTCHVGCRIRCHSFITLSI